MSYKKSKEYAAWQHAKKRCFNPKDKFFHRYGGRGIIMCEKWRNDFLAFFEHVGVAPSKDHCLDRIDNDGNYEPGNVRWSSQKEQANNRSGIRLKKLTLNGITMNQSDWNKKLGFSHGVVNRRIRILGWSVEDALTLPKGACPKGRDYCIKNLGKYAVKKHN